MAYHTLENRFLQFIRKNRLVNEGQRVLLAYSGGLDSSVLLHLLVRLHIPVSAAHCNFSLRGEESDLDEAFCEEQCSALQVPFTSRRFGTLLHAQSNGISIQMAARELRYSWFKELMSAHGYPLLATAHHRGDQAETILLHLVDNKSFEALQGIPLRNGQIIRPLLPFGKEELMRYALEKKIRWREDSSNASIDYRRNQVRHEVLPLLKTLNPSIEDTLVRFGERLQSWNRLAQEETDRLTAGLTEEKQGVFIIHTGSIREHPAIDILLWKLLSPYGFTSTQTGDIRTALEHTGATFNTTGYQLNIDRDRLIIQPVDRQHTDQEWVLMETNGRLDTTHFALESALIPRPEGEFSFPKDPNIAWMDGDSITLPLNIGHWQEGDRFHPLGMEHSKKLSDYFIDRKIPLHEKRRNWVIRSAGQIIWIAGERIDHRFRVKPETKNILILKFTIR
jgi:tRNA(Ile)-lysidine synthase